LEEDFEELYELYGDKMRMHPLVRIPMRTCFMVYMVHLTNQMAMKAPVPNIEEILRTNPDIARQMAAQAMQTQTQQFRQMGQQQMNVPTFASSSLPPPPANNPLSGLMSFLGGTTQPPPPPPQQQVKTIPAKAPIREMKPPTGMGIGDILKNIQKEEKKFSPTTKLPPPPMPSSAKGPTLKSALRRSAGSTDSKKSAKNSVVIKL
jgi:hypothetical protein